MACRISLPFWPTSLNCLSWSADNLLAVAGGDRIAILTPRLGDPGPNNTHWDISIITANAFTAQEVPVSEPLSSANFSVGEELSLRHVQALEWSPPGLARFQRCVLAVLSSNHVLSIWECDGKPNAVGNWKRKVVVNNVLRQHFDSVGQTQKSTPLPGIAHRELRQQKQVSQRIRSFAWSPPMYLGTSGEGQVSNVNVCSSLYFLAVSTEAGNILLMRVQSPHNMLNPDVTEWRLTIMHTFNTGARALIAPSGGVSIEDRDRRSHNRDSFIADSLAWGPWSRNGKRSTALLAFIVNGKLFSTTVVGDSHNSPSLAGVEAEVPMRQRVDSRTNMTGPLRFCRQSGHLVAFCPDAILCINVKGDPKDPRLITSHHLDDRWDEISGLAFSGRPLGSFRAHIVSHLSSASSSTTVLELPLDETASSDQPSWQQAMNESKAIYSAEHDLGGHVQERTWGIATSPLGDYLATCTTMHPSDSIAYIVHSDQYCTVEITCANSTAEDIAWLNSGKSFDPAHMSVESVLFSLQRHLERLDQHGTHNRPNQAHFATLLAQSLGPYLSQPYLENKEPLHDASDTERIVQHLKLNAFLHAEMIRARCKLLAVIAFDHKANSSSHTREIVQRLVTEVLRIPRQNLQESDMSNKICKLFSLVAAKCESLDKPNSAHAETYSEECRICGRSIPFESVKWARCNGGHQFARCGITLFAIQEPGVSKFCTICGAQYLNTAALPSFRTSTDSDVEFTDLSEEQEQHMSQVQEIEDDDQQTSQPWGGWVEVSKRVIAFAEPPQSLCRLLFAAFDTCIYCGGKFVV